MTVLAARCSIYRRPALIGDKTERAYHRGSALEKLRWLMAHWADFFTGVPFEYWTADRQICHIRPLKSLTGELACRFQQALLVGLSLDGRPQPYQFHQRGSID